MKKSTYRLLTAPLLAGAWCTATASADWVDFVNETGSRLIADADIGENDGEEKDYSWGDLNNDGWIDLVVMRKQPFTSSGRRVNVLLMNEKGVLVDRTAEYATDSDVPGDNGFQTPTNDRDSQVIDVNNDGWLDVVTAPTLSDGQPKHISHPRIYINKGEDAGGNWQGLRYESSRIPQLEGIAGHGEPHAPRFCSVGAGDVTGDGYADLYFGDYDQGGGQTFDFGDRLLINDGNGNFADESTQRIPSGWLDSSFTTQSIIADLNGNGVNDIVQVHSLGGYETNALYNDPDNEGYFQSRQTVQNSSTYFATVGDLNNNGRLDIVIADDGNDRWRMNDGNNANGEVNWSSLKTLSESGFRSNVVIEDLNNDTWPDILIADNDVDLGSCGGFGAADIYRHNGNPNNVNFTHDRGNISTSDLQKTFDLAVFDIDGNGWKDIVAGRCGGTDVLMNQPTFGIEFSYPGGRPLQVNPDETTPIQVDMDATGQSLEPDGATMHVSINGGPYQAISMSSAGGDVFEASLPAAECQDIIDYYFTGELDGGGVVTDPLDAPKSTFTAVVAENLDVAHYDDIEGSVSDWDISSDGSLTGGEWEQATPVGTICCGGTLASPDGDASGGGQAFTTENCQPGQFPAGCNVIGGPTYLVSPAYDLSDSNAIISYDRWFFCSNAGNPEAADVMTTQVSADDGNSWVTVHSTGGTNSAWENASFLLSDYVTPSDAVRVRFVVADAGSDSITNAGIDNLQIDEFTCGGPACEGDLDDNGTVNVSDMLALLGAWGECPGKGECPEDLDGNGSVNVSDLLVLLGAWGDCP